MPTTKETKTKKPMKAGGKDKYVEAVGRRKTAVARVRLWSGRPKTSKEPEVIVNEISYLKYFPLSKHQAIAKAPFEALSLKEYSATAQVSGGGVNAQAEAIRLGLARTLVALNPLWRVKLKSLGYLKRDPRMVERKKPGLRKARRPQQWRKR
ncbi:MAG: 30S ribosomal protein S9 [Chloroflexi bacterium]|nr:30S ribosomal protein S9 [Chloroflexota bacterium]